MRSLTPSDKGSLHSVSNEQVLFVQLKLRLFYCKFQQLHKFKNHQHRRLLISNVRSLIIAANLNWVKLQMQNFHTWLVTIVSVEYL